MNPLHRFLQLPSADQWLLVKCAVLLGAIRLGLWLVPFRVLRRLLKKVTRRQDESHEISEGLPGRVAWAMAAAGRFLPRAGNCLAQALAAEVVLGRNGLPAMLRIGVALTEDGGFRAHAWVEVDGTIVVGDSKGLSRFVPLPPLKEEIR